ncbi:hypothetical protein Tco_0484813 [Tanacetum coccineum]
MEAARPSNILARRVTDDLIDFSGETSLPKYMKFFFLQQIAETRRFINIMCEETQTARNCIAQLNALIAKIEAIGDADDAFDTLMCLRDEIRDENNDCSITETASMNNDSRLDMSSLGGLGTQCRRQRFASFTPAICAKPN